MTTDICIYNLENSRFIEKYDKKSSLAIKRHVSAFEQKTKIYVSESTSTDILILHRKINSLDLWLLNEKDEDKLTLLTHINKNVKIFINSF